MARSFASASSQYLVRTSAAVAAFPATFAAWIRPSSVAVGEADIIAIGNSAGATQLWRLARSAARVMANVRNDAAAQSTSTFGSDMTVNTWNHAAAVFSVSGSNVTPTAYQNGTAATAGAAVDKTITVDRTGVGALVRNTAGPFWDGRIAQGAIYSVALTAAEVGDLAAGFSPLVIRPDALVAWWPLLQSDGDVDWWAQNNLTATASPTYADHAPILSPGTPELWVPDPVVFPALFRRTRRALSGLSGMSGRLT